MGLMSDGEGVIMEVVAVNTRMASWPKSPCQNLSAALFIGSQNCLTNGYLSGNFARLTNESDKFVDS